MTEDFDLWERSLLDWLTEHPPPSESEGHSPDSTGIATKGILTVEFMGRNGGEWLHTIRIGGTAWTAEGMARYQLRAAKRANGLDDPD